MKKCKYCNADMYDYETTCRYCGSVQPEEGSTPPPYGAGNSAHTNGNYGYNNQYNSYNSSSFNAQDYYQRNNAFDSNANGKSRGIAALLAILLGGLGIQYFYLGKSTAAIITILLSLVTCGLWEIVMFIQGILMLCMSNYDFNQKYVDTQSSFPVF